MPFSKSHQGSKCTINLRSVSIDSVVIPSYIKLPCSYIETIVKPCVFKNQKGSLLCWFDWKENPKKGLRQWKKVSLSQKQNCVYMCE